MGYIFKTGPELEFFLFEKDGDDSIRLPHDKAGYFDYSMDLAYTVRKDMVKALKRHGHRRRGQPPRSRHRSARDRLRIRSGRSTADRATTFKIVAESHRPAARPACHLHAEADRGHQRFRHARPHEPWLPRQERANAFVDEDAPTACPTVAKQLHCRASWPTRAACPACSRRW